MGKAQKIAIVGAGLSGLSCAYYLEKDGYAIDLYEMNNSIGGRIQTDKEQGCLLDRGFQIVLSSYPEVNKIFNKSELNLKHFPTGVKVRYEGKWQTILNPFRHPLSFLFNSTNQTVISREDLWKFVKIYFSHGFSPVAVLDEDPESLNSYLKSLKISEHTIESFLRPLFASVFFDDNLMTSKNIFTWVMRYFMEGAAALPASGMHALPQKLFNKLKTTQTFLNSEVAAVEGQSLYIAGGQEKKYDKIILAGALPNIYSLVHSTPLPNSCKTICLYFLSRENIANADNFLHLNAIEEGPINELAFVNKVQPTYASSKYTLASITVLKKEWQQSHSLEEAAYEQLSKWFPTKSQSWQHLKTYHIEHALPEQRTTPPLLGHYQIARQPDIYVCGEATDLASINGAIFSGRHVAEIIKKVTKPGKEE